MNMGRRTKKTKNSIRLKNALKAEIVCFLFSMTVSYGAVLADSVNDWQAAYTNDGVLNQGEFGWEYGYISNYTGMGNIYYGWHQSFYYWDQTGGIPIFWPTGYIPPTVAWGEGGDTTGCRPPMHWSDGAYSWAEGLTNRWAATRRWVSDYTGAVDITGTVGRYFDPLAVPGWDMLFAVSINAQSLDAPSIYSRPLLWNDAGVYQYLIPAVPVKQGDSVDFLFIPLNTNSSNSHIRIHAMISETIDVPSCDLDGSGTVDMNDFLILASYWQNADCGKSNWCGQADLNYDWRTDMADLSIFISDWLTHAFPKGDFDSNYRVDLADMAIFSRHWNSVDCDVNAWCQGCDLNRDRVVDLADLNEVLKNWLTIVSPLY